MSSLVVEPSIESQPEVRKNLRFNFLVNVGDGAFFGLGLGLTSFTTVIPLFVSTFTDSAILIGLIPAMHVLGWQLPQLFTARWVSTLKRFKPALLAISIQERIPFLGLAILAYYSHLLTSQMVLWLVFLLLSWHGLAAGFAANPWQNLLAKVIPGEIRATFFGAMNSASNLLGSVGAILAGILLEKYLFPNNFALCFLLTFLALLGSYGFLALNRETGQNKVEFDQSNSVSQKLMIRRILKSDPRFVIFLITRISYQFGLMALAFLTVFSVTELKVTTVTIGILTSILMVIQVLSNPILGWLADHWGKRNAFIMGSMSALISAVLAATTHQVWLLFPVFLFMGIANSAYWTIGMAYSLEFGTDSEKPTYIGLSNTLVAPAVVLAPLIGGWLAEAGGYRLTFIISAIFALITSILLLGMDRKPDKKKILPAT